jgi:hypothetical protein
MTIAIQMKNVTTEIHASSRLHLPSASPVRKPRKTKEKKKEEKSFLLPAAALKIDRRKLGNAPWTSAKLESGRRVVFVTVVPIRRRRRVNQCTAG